jgi:quinol-cytochrome oxidoreductase complex cytochrome b subunit
MAFTGYLLPWDQKAYWATTVGTSIAGETPLIGNWLKTLLIGGSQIGAVTLTRFFTLHVAIIPGLLFTFIGLHLFLVIRLGVSPTPKSTELACER